MSPLNTGSMQPGEKDHPPAGPAFFLLLRRLG